MTNSIAKQCDQQTFDKFLIQVCSVNKEILTNVLIELLI